MLAWSRLAWHTFTCASAELHRLLCTCRAALRLHAATRRLSDGVQVTMKSFSWRLRCSFTCVASRVGFSSLA